jgi:hypothetical protein
VCPSGEAQRRRPGAPSRPDILALAKELGQAGGKCSGVPPASVLEAPQELAGELGIVGVLAKGKLRVRSLLCPAGSKPIVHVRSSHLGRLGLDDESQGVAECLAQQRSGELILRYPDTGSTSRPQCLQTRARARIRSAQ